MNDGLRIKIIELRKNGKTYNEIKRELGCTKSTISYHCNRFDLGAPIKNRELERNEILIINEYYKSHTIKESCDKFNISKSKLYQITDNKTILLSEDEKKKRNYEKVKLHRQKIKEKAVEYKGSKCQKCGYNKCIWSFDFHHVIPEEKDFSISRNSTLSWEKVKKELDKCIMLCANCHRELHYSEYIDKLYDNIQ